MSTQNRTQLYIITIVLAAVGLAAFTGWLWPLADHNVALWYIPVFALLVVVTGRFPIQISRQAEASLVIVPIFMAVLILHPLEATIITALGTLIAERWMRAPYRAIIFNTGVNSMAAVLGGIAFYNLSPEASSFGLTQGQMLAAGAAGVAVYVTNFSMVVGMVTIRKGMVFWGQWRDTFAFEAIQEGGLLSVGLISAILISLEWWAPIMVAIPAALAYVGFRRIVGEAAEKTRMAQELEQSIKELKEIQAQLIQSAKMSSVGSLATGIAHEINNPVFAISGRADLLLKAASKHLQSEKSVEYVKNIQEMAGRISNITRHLMEYAQTSDDRKGVSIPEVVEASLTLLGKQIKTTRIIKEYDERDPIIVEGVPSQLQQVFIDLIKNAMEAIPDWGSVTIGCGVEDDMAVAYVKDTGDGIPDEIKDRLFEPFVTSKHIGSRIGMGTGLYTCHRIIEAHNGEISIESEAGKGTTVWIKIPLAEVDDLNDQVLDSPFSVAVGNE